MEICAMEETHYVQEEIVPINAILIAQRFVRTHGNPVPAIY